MFDKVIRTALNAEQLAEYGIPKNVLDPEVADKLDRDPRMPRFRARHGYVDQYELDALDPNVLRDLYPKRSSRSGTRRSTRPCSPTRTADRGEL